MSNYESLRGYATPEGTNSYVQYAMKKGIPADHFRSFDKLNLSSIGMGTYLGELTKEDDEAIENAVYESVNSGAINVIDTAINYRAMKSEKSIGRGISRLCKEGSFSRNQIFICTKNGYITNDGDYPSVDVLEYIQKLYISPQIISPEDISSGYNIMNPNYIERCIDKSLMNMHLDTIDLVYIHNAFESWYEDVNREKFMQMLQRVFETYEKCRSLNKIRYYGMATWTCFRVDRNSKDYLSLEDVVHTAENVSGGGHGFKYIQLPYNLAYTEALFLKNQSVGADKNLSILEAASRLNVGVFTSVPLFQGRLLRSSMPGLGKTMGSVGNLVQIVRSSPTVIAPLIGQKKPEHVKENLEIAKTPPFNRVEFEQAVESMQSNKGKKD